MTVVNQLRFYARERRLCCSLLLVVPLQIDLPRNSRKHYDNTTQSQNSNSVPVYDARQKNSKRLPNSHDNGKHDRTKLRDSMENKELA